MSKILWKSLPLCPAVLAASLVCVASAVAQPQQLVAEKPDEVLNQVVQYGKEGTNTQDDTIGQVTSVSQLKDVQPTDWAFQALQSLVERYGVIAGYPDGTFRGNRAMTRYEFAAGLNAALDRVNELIAAGSTSMVRREDIETLHRLQQEFGPELASLRGRVDSLEAQTAQLEANQFSTTTKLVGEDIFAISDNFGNYRNDNAVFTNRVRLDFQTSFTGKDTLHTRIAAGNAQRFNFQNRVAPGGFGTYEGSGSLINVFEPNTSNSVSLDWLAYYFPIFKNSQVYVAASGALTNDIVPGGNPYFDDGGDGGSGSISVFSQVSPIYRIGGGAGAGLNLVLSDKGILKDSSLSLGYFADNAANPGRSSGFTKGDYVAIGQVNLNITDRFSIAGTYANGYHTTGSGIFNVGTPGSNSTPFQAVVGSAQSNDPSLLYGVGGQRPITTNSYGGEVAFRLTKKISLSGFVEETLARIKGRGDADIWSYGAGIAFPDFGKNGSVLGLFAGVEPTLRGLRAVGIGRNFGRRDEDWHYEAFYKYQVSDNISITPGIVVLTAPGQNIRNNNAWIGTLRTTFTF